MAKLSVNKIKLNPDNPRFIKDDKYKSLVKSLQEFPEMADVREVVVNSDYMILGGNMRYRAMKEAGWKEIPVRVVDWSEEKQREFIIKDNSNFGEWDWDILANEWSEEDLENWGVDLPTNWNTGEVVEDEPPELSDEPAVSKLGEVYQLGRHRLMCGDSTKIEDVEKLMDGKKADMVFTDPPYGVSYASKNEFLNNQDKGNCIQTHIENDHMSLQDTENFIYECFVNLRLMLADKSSYYITAPQGCDLLMMMMMMQKAGLTLRHMLIWVKNNHVLGRTDYNYKHEPILFGWVDTHNFYGNGKYKFSTWEIDKPHKSDLHPTMKPIELVANAIRNSSKDDDIVLDLFGGSGSTLIACEQTNRTCYMMELDEKYCDVMRKRYHKFTTGDEEGWIQSTPKI
jgi:DNA modification methylase